LKRKVCSDDTVSSPVLKQIKLINGSKLSTFKQNTLDSNILNYVVNSMKPLSTVSDEYFIKIIHGMYDVSNSLFEIYNLP